MNPEIINLINQYRQGIIPVDVFLTRMQAMGIDQDNAIRALNEVGAAERVIEPRTRDMAEEVAPERRGPPPQPALRAAPAAFTAQDLVRRAINGEITMDQYYSQMMSLGMPQAEAQTMLSNAAGGTQQGMDQSLTPEMQPLSQADAQRAQQNLQIDALSGQAPEAGYPRFQRPMTQEEIELARPVEQRQPILPRVFNQMGRDIRSLVAGEPSATAQPQTSYASPQVASPTAQDVVDRAREITTTPDQTAAPITAPQAAPQATTPTAPTTGFNPAMAGPRPGYDDPNAMTPAIEQAIAIAKTQAQPRPVASGQSQTASGQQTAAPDTSAAATPSMLAQIIRGRFGEAAKGNPMDDRLTAAQEARDRMESGMAKGGAVGGGKDAAIHKALEIIHHLIAR